MKVNFFPVLFLFLVVISIFSCKTNFNQEKPINKEINYIPYYLKVYEADSLYIVKNYQKSYEILDSLFKKYEPLNMDIYYEYPTYLKSKIKINKDISKIEVERLVKKYGYTNDYISNDLDFKDSNFFIFLYKNDTYQKLRSEYLFKTNKSLRDSVIQMKKFDQLYRNSDYTKNLNIQNRLDSINTKKLKEIFNIYGFPNKNIIGNFSVDNKNVDIQVVLLHTKDSIRLNYFMPKVLEYVKKGNADPQVYATLYDQYLLYNNEEQYYGSYDNKINIDLKIINERRKSIGLANYGFDKWRLKTLYPDYYK